MEKFKAYLTMPYQEKGILLGTLDWVFRAVTLFVWCYIVTILFRLLMDSLLMDYNPVSKMWWCSYSFLILFGASWLAYIALFVRSYYSDDDED